MRNRTGPVLLVVLVVTVALLAVAVLVSVWLPSAPSASGPAHDWYSFVPGLAAYDAAQGYDVWLMSDGSTWTYAHGDWSNITATAGVPVGMEDGSRLTYDARDSYVLLYGGATRTLITRPLNDTWTFEGGRWTNITATVRGAPPPMILGVMTYDSEDKDVVVFGGSNVNASSGSAYGLQTNETWTYAGGVWTNATVPGPPPFGGFYSDDPFAGLVDDPADGYLLYYNSLGGPGPPATPIMWSYVGGAWTNRTAELSSAPNLQMYAGFLYDSTARAVLAIGTCVSTPGYECQHRFGATFEYSGGVWKDVTPSSRLAEREANGYVDDPSDGGVMIVGGCCWADFSGLSLGWQDAWVYAHGTWTESEPWGGTPGWTENNGTWLALAVGVASVSVVVVTGRAKSPPRPS